MPRPEQVQCDPALKSKEPAALTAEHVAPWKRRLTGTSAHQVLIGIGIQDIRHRDRKDSRE